VRLIATVRAAAALVQQRGDADAGLAMVGRDRRAVQSGAGAPLGPPQRRRTTLDGVQDGDPSRAGRNAP